MKRPILFLVCSLFYLITSCKKHGCTDSTALNYSSFAKKDDGSCVFNSDINTVYIEEFWVHFGPGVSYDSYFPNFNKEDGDVLIVEVESDNINGTIYWSSLPYHLGVNNAYMRAEYGESGLVWIETLYEDGSPANWTGSASYHMRVALVKKNGIYSEKEVKNMTIDEIEELI